MTLDIEKIKAAGMAATQGEWIANKSGGVRTVLGDDSTRGRARWQGVFRQADADFIALANPQAVLELITRLREAESRWAVVPEGHTLITSYRYGELEAAEKFIELSFECHPNLDLDVAAMKESEK